MNNNHFLKKTSYNQFDFFTFQDLHENQIWFDKVSLFLSKGNATRKYLRICDKHFKDSDVERTFQTVLKDGTINEIPREKFKLNKGNVPCIFDVHQDNFEGESMDIGDESLSVLKIGINYASKLCLR